jgi:hypothetical protein
MNEPQPDICVEYSESIDRRPEDVWAVLRELRGTLLPNQAPALPRAPAEPAAQSGHPALRLCLVERLTTRDDTLMLLALETTHCLGLPWSTQSTMFRVRPALAGRSTVMASCLASPTAEPRVVAEMLRGMLVFALGRLKAAVEQDCHGSAARPT